MILVSKGPTGFDQWQETTKEACGYRGVLAHRQDPWPQRRLPPEGKPFVMAQDGSNPPSSPCTMKSPPGGDRESQQRSMSVWDSPCLLGIIHLTQTSLPNLEPSAGLEFGKGKMRLHNAHFSLGSKTLIMIQDPGPPPQNARSGVDYIRDWQPFSVKGHIVNSFRLHGPPAASVTLFFQKKKKTLKMEKLFLAVGCTKLQNQAKG